MTNLFIIGFIVFLTFIVGMAIGVFFGRKPIQGSCGGLGQVMGKNCPYCKNPENCQRKKPS